MIGEIGKAAPSHLAGTRIGNGVPPNNSICMETFGQHAHIKGRVMCNEHPTFKKAPELWPHIWKRRRVGHCRRCNPGQLYVKSTKVDLRIDQSREFLYNVISLYNRQADGTHAVIGGVGGLHIKSNVFFWHSSSLIQLSRLLPAPIDIPGIVPGPPSRIDWRFRSSAVSSIFFLNGEISGSYRTRAPSSA